MATIRDVARASGVSTATVSRILSEDPAFKVSEEAKQRVYRAVSELGYVYVSKRRGAQRISLGFVLSLTAEKYSDPFFMTILSAAEEECLKYNAAIIAIRNYNELKNPEMLRELCSMGLDGIILAEELPEEILGHLRCSIPHIIAVDLPSSEFDCIGFDYFEANMQIMEHLLSLGYRRIAYIGGETSGIDFRYSTRLAVYREALYRAGIPYDETLIRNCHWDLDLCVVQTEELLSMPSPPDVIFAGSDSLASVVLSTVYRMELRCPDNVGVVGFNNLNISAHTIPPLTTLDVPKREIGIELISRLMEMIAGNAGPRKTVLYPTHLVSRGSLREHPPRMADKAAVREEE